MKNFKNLVLWQALSINFFKVAVNAKKNNPIKNR